MEKIVFTLPSDNVASAETLWAKQTAPDVFELMNIPLLAYGANVGDSVTTRIGADGRRYFVAINKRGGHRTFRAAGNGGGNTIGLRETLESFGALVEIGGGDYLAIDAANDEIAAMVIDALESGQAKGLWEFEESGTAELFESQ